MTSNFKRCTAVTSSPFSIHLLSPAPRPIASAEDSAYWSATPKLVDAWKESNSLGLAIMTREVSSLLVYVCVCVCVCMRVCVPMHMYLTLCLSVCFLCVCVCILVFFCSVKHPLLYFLLLSFLPPSHPSPHFLPPPSDRWVTSPHSVALS